MIFFSLLIALAVSFKFGHVMFPLSFISKYVLIFLVVSSLTHQLFSSVLLNLHIFVNFLNFFVTDFKFHCTVVGEYTVNDFNLFKFN